MSHTTTHDTAQAFTQFFNERLNKEQQDIVSRSEGVMIVHAGAGSGKTRVITARITSLLLNHEVSPHALIALTFTNKAAREMKERVTHFLGKHTPLPFVGTFHAYCLRLLKTYKSLLGLSSFTILDEDDKEKLIKSILLRHNVHKRITPRAIISDISRIKNSTQTGTIPYELIVDPVMRDIISMYEREKTACQALDFDDLLLYTVRLFKQNPSFKQEHQARVRHVLVDEYQDTNRVQNSLIQEMTLTSNLEWCLDSLCVVGDEDQSIYSWRGAQAHTMLSFKETFTTTQALTLEQNYRSVQPILDTANYLIEQNTQRNPKKLWSARTAQDRVRVLTCSSGHQEAQLAAELCKRQLAERKSLNEVALLYRSHYQSRTLEEALVRNSIPYIIVGGIQFYDRLEVKDVLAYLKLLVNPFDRISWSRAINTPARGLGDKFQELFIATWEQNPFLDFIQVSNLVITEQLVTGTKRSALESFIRIFQDLNTAEPLLAVESILTRTRYFAYLEQVYSEKIEEIQERTANVQELVNAVRSSEERGVTSLSTFLEEVALLQEHVQTFESQERVSLMTLHAAKGLEFNAVMITGLEEGVLPSGHAIYSTEAVEEERRLFYVGITRAREHLLITHARCRSIYGQTNDQRSSRFIKEILASPHVSTADIAYWNSQQVSSYFNDWFSERHTTKPQTEKHKTVLTEPDKLYPGKNKTTWHLQQQVYHKVFGAGRIENIDQKDATTTYLTIRFKNELKKISAVFVATQPTELL